MSRRCGSALCRQPLPRLRDPGRGMCDACCERVRGVLADLARLHEASVVVLAPARGPVTDRVRGGSRTEGVLLDQAVVDARAEILDALAGWAARVAAEHATGAPPARRVPRLAAYLARALDRFATAPTACELESDLAALADRAGAALDPGRRDEREIGRCVHDGCDAPLRAGGPGVGCSAGHTFSPAQWLGIAASVRQEPVRRSA